MTYLLLQIFLLLTGAFLLGAIAACLLRTFLFAAGPSTEDDRTGDPTREQADLGGERAASAAQDRFTRALTGVGLASDPEPAFLAPKSIVGPAVSPMADAVRVAAAALAAERRVQSEAAKPPTPPAPPPSPPAAQSPPPKQTAPTPPSLSPTGPPPPKQAAASPPPPASSPCSAPEMTVEAQSRPPTSAVAPSAGALATMAPKPAASPAVVPSGKADDLTLIRAVDRATADKLVRLGVTRFEQIARWRADDVARANGALGLYGRVERENWIEQAALLAKGERPAPVEEQALPKSAPSSTIAPAAPKSAETPPPLPPKTVAAAPPSKTVDVAPPPGPAKQEDLAPPAPAPTKNEDARPPSPSPEPGDSLRRIVGIDAQAEQLLHAQGVTRFSQITNWNSSDVRRIERMLGRVGRVVDENWIEQARVLAAGTPVAPRPRSSLEGMKSVRSEALRGGADEDREGKPADDLKRIRGIGVLIERRLNSLAVTGFEQIANWTGADIERVSRALDVKDRIERENWVEQARILASGGQTAYSRRSPRSDG